MYRIYLKNIATSYKNNSSNIILVSWFIFHFYHLLEVTFSLFYINKKKVLDSRNFSTSGFRWIYMFWNILNTIWLFLKNVCPCVCMCMSPKFCGHCNLRTNARKLMIRYIQLHFDIVWCRLDFGVYHSRKSAVVPNLWFI